MRAILGLFLTFLFTVASAGQHYPPVSVQVRAEQIASHSYYIPGMAGAASTRNQGFMSNAGFVITPAGVVVFDTLGSPSLAQEMVKRIRADAQPIKRVIVSHYHADHYYGIQVFQDLGAEIWAHQGRQERRSARRRPNALRATQGNTRHLDQRPDAALPRTRSLVVRRYRLRTRRLALRIRHVGPAHSDEDLALFVEQDGVLFTGDLVFKGRVPFVGDADSKRWLNALDKLIALRPAVLVPGHGGASDTPIQDLTLTRDYLLFLRAKWGAPSMN
jgi:glyoxylase-like metal-dependent hydrolase (beta-lactamase superfamily II)